MAEKFGHIELVSATISLLQNGSEPDNTQPKDSLLTDLNGSNGTRHQFLNSGSSALVANALGAPWQGNDVFSSGSLVLDMLHNFFLESATPLMKNM